MNQLEKLHEDLRRQEDLRQVNIKILKKQIIESNPIDYDSKSFMKNIKETLQNIENINEELDNLFRKIDNELSKKENK